MRFHSLFAAIALVSCLQDSETQVIPSLEEDSPNLNLDRFETNRFDDCEILILKELTGSTMRSTESVRVDYNNLALEKHIIVSIDSNSYVFDFNKHNGVIEIETFRSYAYKMLKNFKNIMRHAENSELTFSLVNGIPCYRTYFEASSYGFPKRKSYWIRYFKTETGYYSMVCWTTITNKSNFENEAIFMGQSFKESMKL